MSSASMFWVALAAGLIFTVAWWSLWIVIATSSNAPLAFT
jgi:hypothetical protein